MLNRMPVRLPLVLYLLALTILAVAIMQFGWKATWSSVFVQSFEPVFMDMRTVPAGLQAAREGLDPQQVNPADARHRVMDYPSIWLKIGAWLHLEEERAYVQFCLGMIAIFVFTNALMLWRWPSFWLLAATLSSSVLLLMERGNNDLLIYVLVVLFAVLVPRAVASVPLILAVVLKLFPVFAVALLWLQQRWRGAFATTLLMLVVAALMFHELVHLRAGIKLGMGQSYGLQNLAAIFRGEGSTGMMQVLILGLLLVAATLVMRWRIRLGLLPSRTATYDNNLYLCGLVIYVGTFVAASNWDYRLVFLALCIPKLTTVTSGAVRRWHTGLLVAILLALNYRVLHDILGVAGVALNLGAKLWLFVDALAVLLMLASQAMQSGTKYLRSQS